MNNVEIASRIRRILYNANELRDINGGIDLASNYCYIIEELTELLLDIIEAPEK